MSEIFTQFLKNPASVLINFIVLYASHSNKTDDYINSLNTTGLKNLVRSRRSLSNVHIYTFAVKRYVLCVSLTIVKQNGLYFYALSFIFFVIFCWNTYKYVQTNVSVRKRYTYILHIFLGILLGGSVSRYVNANEIIDTKQNKIKEGRTDGSRCSI